MTEVLEAESGTAKDGGAQQRARRRLGREALLLRGNLLTYLNGGHGQELLVHQTGSRQAAIQCGTSFAEQVLDAEVRAQFGDRAGKVEGLALACGDYHNVGAAALGSQALSSGRRGENRGVDDVAVEHLVSGQIEVDRAGHENIPLPAFA